MSFQHEVVAGRRRRARSRPSERRRGEQLHHVREKQPPAGFVVDASGETWPLRCSEDQKRNHREVLLRRCQRLRLPNIIRPLLCSQPRCRRHCSLVGEWERSHDGVAAGVVLQRGADDAARVVLSGIQFRQVEVVKLWAQLVTQPLLGGAGEALCAFTRRASRAANPGSCSGPTRNTAITPISCGLSNVTPMVRTAPPSPACLARPRASGRAHAC